LIFMSRQASIERTTRETKIAIDLNIDGTGTTTVNTGIGFLDHMLDLFGHHGLFDLKVEAQGDLQVDFHHTVEDTGITLGQAFARALGDKAGITRYGSALIPMDEALTRVVVDCSGRPFFRYGIVENFPPMGNFPFQLVEEFLRAFTVHSQINLHVDLLAGRDSHHIAESIFKGLARAMEEACRIHPRVTGIPSTKGTLA
jgi:imidazoleglycerol-phosphate dehydratase